MALCFIEPELLPVRVLHCGNRDSQPYFACLSLTLIHIRIWPVFARDIGDVRKWNIYIKAFESYHLTDIHTDRQTRPKLYTTLLRGWWNITYHYLLRLHHSIFEATFSCVCSLLWCLLSVCRRCEVKYTGWSCAMHSWWSSRRRWCRRWRNPCHIARSLSHALRPRTNAAPKRYSSNN